MNIYYSITDIVKREKTMQLSWLSDDSQLLAEDSQLLTEDSQLFTEDSQLLTPLVFPLISVVLFWYKPDI